MTLVYSLIPWFALVVIAITNGLIRQKFILPKFGEQTAHVISTISFIIMQFMVIFIFVNWISIFDFTSLLQIGLFWVALTILFEFGFGHFVVKHSWQKLLADYNIFKGRLWLLVLINNIFAPIFSGYLLSN